MPSVTLEEAWDVIERCPTGMAVVDENGLIQFANPAAAALLRADHHLLIGTPLGVPVTGGKSIEIEIPRHSGEKGIAEIRALALEWVSQPAYLVTFHDVTERHHAELKIWHQAFHDGLTGLLNREHFHQHLAETIDRVHHQGRGLAVLFLDLDRFKSINDTLGHAAGDELLKTIADRLRAGVRDIDAVARMSGDEFTVLLEGVSDRDTAMQVAHNLRESISAPVALDMETVTPMATIGISLYPEDAEDVDTLLVRADTAMYHGKQLGRNQTHNFSAGQAHTRSRRFRLEQALRRALDNAEFRVFYQPRAVLPEGRVVDAEALLRWENPEVGLVQPAEFVPLLEESGLVDEVGEWVIRQATADMSRWRAENIGLDRVWINVAIGQLANHALHERLDRLVADTGLSPEHIGIELTESSVARDIDQVARLVQHLHDRGYRISLDDFGSGFSALSFLCRLPLRELKIDRNLVAGIEVDPMQRKLVSAIIQMAHGLDLEVVAEGVENMDQLDCLAADYCDLAQGFLLGQPMTYEQFTVFQRSAGMEAVRARG